MRDLAPHTLATLAVASGATTPVPAGGAGSLIWSSSTNSALVWNGGQWAAVGGGGSGDVVGPASAADNAIARFDGTTGKLLQQSLFGIDDTGTLEIYDSSSGQTMVQVYNNSGVQTGSVFYSPDRSKSCGQTMTNSGGNFFCNADLVFSVTGTGSLNLTTGGVTRITVNSTGNVSIAAPSSGAALAVAGETQTNSLRLAAQSSDPAAPASGNGLLYSRALAGRNVPRFRAPNGAPYALAPHLGGPNVRTWRGGATTSGTTFAATIGAMPYSSASPGTTAIAALASTNLLTQTYRSTLTTAATAGSICYIRGSSTTVWRGNAASLGGFLVIHRIGLSGTLQSGLRVFAGLVDVASNPTNVDPTSTTTPGGVGVAVNANTGNWKIVSNVSGTARTSTDLGANFPVNNTDLLEIALFCVPNDSGIGYQATNLSTGNTTSGTLTTNIPASTTFLAPSVWVTNNATAAAQAFEYVSTYVETDY